MISIIIPIYNREKILNKTFDSILGQTYKNIEVIAVDDGSQDKSTEVAHGYKADFEKLKIPYLVLEKANGGAPSARNMGWKKSKGDFLFFCDADAVLVPEALEIMFEKINDNPDAGYVYSSFYWGKKLFKIGEFDKERLKQAPFIHTMSLIRRNNFPPNGWDESIKKLQDWDLWLTMLENGHTGLWIDQVLFTVEPGGTISSWLPSFAYKLMPFLPSVKKYKKAVEVVKEKHGLFN